MDICHENINLILFCGRITRIQKNFDALRKNNFLKLIRKTRRRLTKVSIEIVRLKCVNDQNDQNQRKSITDRIIKKKYDERNEQMEHH